MIPQLAINILFEPECEVEKNVYLKLGYFKFKFTAVFNSGISYFLIDTIQRDYKSTNIGNATNPHKCHLFMYQIYKSLNINTSLQCSLYPGSVPIVRAVPPVVTELVFTLDETLHE